MNKTTMNKNVINLFIGTILGDASIRTSKQKISIVFNQRADKSEYINHLYNVLTLHEFVSSTKVRRYEYLDKRYMKTYSSLSFSTKSLKELQFLSFLFIDNTGKKFIPRIIKDLLEIEGLAYWIIDDGQEVKRGGVTLCTDRFRFEEVSFLAKILLEKFNLERSIHLKKGKFGNIYSRIYLKKRSLDLIKPELQKYILPMF